MGAWGRCGERFDVGSGFCWQALLTRVPVISLEKVFLLHVFNARLQTDYTQKPFPDLLIRNMDYMVFNCAGLDVFDCASPTVEPERQLSSLFLPLLSQLLLLIRSAFVELF